MLFYKILRLNCWCWVFFGLLCVVWLYQSILIIFSWILLFLQVVFLIGCIICWIFFLLFFLFLIWKLGLFFSLIHHQHLILIGISFLMLNFVFNVFFLFESFCLCLSLFSILHFRPLYFSFISLFNAFILRLSRLCLRMIFIHQVFHRMKCASDD